LTTKYTYKCKLNPQKRFNIPIFHGIFCKHRISENEALKRIDKMDGKEVEE
jgi:hypothetical protein